MNVVKKNKLLFRLFKVLSLLCLWGPLLGFSFYALGSSQTVVVQKLGVSITLLAAIIISAFNIIAKKHLRSPFYLILLGLYIGLGQILTCLIVLVSTSLLDEFCFHPLCELYKAKYISSKEAVAVYGELQG